MIESKSGFLVCGIFVRTNNTTEAGADSRLPKLWAKFKGENVLAQIPNKMSQDVIAVYTNYRSDYNGDYECFIGARVAIPTNDGDFKTVAVKPGKYVHLQSDGEFPEAIQQLWKKVWAMGDKDLGGQRAYSTDYEIYPATVVSADPQPMDDLQPTGEPQPTAPPQPTTPKAVELYIGIQ